MEKKIIRQFVDKGFGFPVVLENVPMRKVRGDWTPFINYNNLARHVLRSVAELDGRLSGNQVRFIRQHFEMTLQSFSERFGVTHPAVLKWERTGDKATGMNWSTEKDIRLFVKIQLKDSPKQFVELYSHLEAEVKNKIPKVRLNVQKLAA